MKLRAARAQSAVALLAVTALLSCVTPYDVLPLCGPVARRDLPTRVCVSSQEAVVYRAQLATEVLRRSQWEYPFLLPLRVEIGEAGRVGRVCVGSQTLNPSWNTRDRVAGSLAALRAATPAPACLVGTTVDLTDALTELGVPLGSAPTPLGLSSCAGLDDRRCTNQLYEVCAALRDGTRRTYPNACDACRDPDVIGYHDFHCQ